MPVILPDMLPAKKVLEAENIHVISENYDFCNKNTLKILILNLMPLKHVTETHLLRMLSGSSLTIKPELLTPATHVPKTTPKEHIDAFYRTFDKIKDLYFDGMIMTGAPVELIDFEAVTYWEELCEIMEWSKTHVSSTFYICWGAQAGLYYHFGIGKYELPRKMSGIFMHKVHLPDVPLVMGFDDCFAAPHSRYTGVAANDIIAAPGLSLVSDSAEAGVYIAKSNDNKQIFVTGHPEYDDLTLHEEYWRDIKKGLNIHVPENYYPDNNPRKNPMVTWRKHAKLLYSNWINYYAKTGKT